jgi:hypothetical protein
VLPARSLVFSVWRCPAIPLELKAPTGYLNNRDIPIGVRNQVKSSSSIWVERRHARPQRRDSLAAVGIWLVRGPLRNDTRTQKSISGQPRRRGGRAIDSIPNQLVVQALEARREVVAAWDGFVESADPAGAIDRHGSGDIGLPAFGPYPYCDESSFAAGNRVVA